MTDERMDGQTWLQLYTLPSRSIKIDFQDGCCCHRSHLGFLISTILAIFDLQVTLMLPIKCLLVQEKKRKIDFQDGHHYRLPIGRILAIFDL